MSGNTITTCRAEALLREWSELRRVIYADGGAHLYDETALARFKKIQHDEISQVIPRSDIGAAFQLLLVATTWPFRPDDPSDRWEDCSDEATHSLTDGNDYKTRLAAAAYLHLTRTIADVDLRDAERYMTAEHIDGGGILQLIRDSRFDADLRKVA